MQSFVFQHNAPCHETVGRLLDFLLKSPVWRFHALLRSLSLTGQDHITMEVLGLDPQKYSDEIPRAPGCTGSTGSIVGAEPKTPESLNALPDALLKGWTNKQMDNLYICNL